MSRVTVHYGITGPVDFLNVDVDRDNKLFLDPSAIRVHALVDPLAQRADHCLRSFFGQVLQARTSTIPDHARGLSLLERLHEPNETRLGLSVAGVAPAGHAFGAEMGQRLWDVLGREVFARRAAVSRIEELALFVADVGDDLISDLTTRIVYEVLADFTALMCRRHPELAADLRTTDVEVWNPTQHDWIIRAIQLPYVDPHPLLLVPKRWVYWRMLMDPDAFYNHFGTGTVQVERTVIDRHGKKIAPLKRSLREEFPDVKDLNTRQTLKYLQESRDLIGEYRRRVEEYYRPLSDAELERRLSN